LYFISEECGLNTLIIEGRTDYGL